MNAYLVIAVASSIGAAVLAVLAIKEKRKVRRAGSLRGGISANAFLLMLYSTLSRNRLTRAMLYYIRKRLEFYSRFDERAVRKKTVVVFLVTSAAFIAFLLLFWLMTRDALMLLVFLLFLFFLADTVIDVFVSNIQMKLLRQQLVYHELLRHKYYELKSIEDANYEACEALSRRSLYEIYI